MQHSKLDMWKGLGLDNDICNSISLSRDCTDFWIKKIQVFFHTFSKTIFLFPDSRLSNRWAIETLKKAGTKLYQRCAANVHVQARLNTIWRAGKKFHSQSTCCSFQKNLFTIFFPGFFSVFQTFSRSGKLLGKFQAFFKNLRLCMNPFYFKNYQSEKVCY